MTAATVSLVVLCALVAMTGAGAGVLARSRVTAKDRRVAALFAAPAPLLLGLAAVAAAGSQSLAIAPLLAAAAVCAGAAWAVLPTAGSRFDRFERHFWAYVHAHARQHTR